MPKNDIPVYLVAGFLDGGKTNFINGILEDGFAREERRFSSAARRAKRNITPKLWTTSPLSPWTAKRISSVPS